WSYADTGSQPPPSATPTKSQTLKGTPAKSPEPMSVEKLRETSAWQHSNWAREPWSWSGGWADSSWAWGNTWWAQGYVGSGSWYGHDAWGRGWSDDSLMAGSEASPGETSDPAGDVKSLLKRPVTTESHLGHVEEEADAWAKKQHDLEELLEKATPELRNLDTQSTLPLPGRSSSELLLDEDRHSAADILGSDAGGSASAEYTAVGGPECNSSDSAEYTAVGGPECSSDSAEYTARSGPECSSDSAEYTAGSGPECNSDSAEYTAGSGPECSSDSAEYTAGSGPECNSFSAEYTAGSGPECNSNDSAEYTAKGPECNTSDSAEYTAKGPECNTSDSAEYTAVGGCHSKSGVRQDVEMRQVWPAVGCWSFVFQILQIDQEQVPQTGSNAPDAVKDEFQKANKSLNRTQKFHDMWIQFISCKGRWHDSTLVLSVRKSKEKTKDVVYMYKTYKTLVSELGQELADDLVKRAREADPTYSGKSCRLHPQFPKREEMQLYKSFAYIKDKTRDKKSQSAEIEQRGDNIDEDDLANAMEDALPSGDDEPMAGIETKPKKDPKPKKDRTWRQLGDAADKKANKDLIDYQGFEKVMTSAKMAANMKKAILDDIRPAHADLQKCKNLVAQGLGKKLSEQEMKPLVEALQAALEDFKIVSEPVRTAERKSNKDANPKPSAKSKGAAKKK
ncbi:unnamed protein product, partial [Symbiodinium sp. CCMP2456]